MPADLLTSPRWQPEHLGLPMPDDPHAVSSCLPLWSHNIAYEEGDPQVVDQLQAAYPRFCVHPAVRRLCQICFSDGSGLPFVSEAAANRAVNYVTSRGGSSATVTDLPGDFGRGVSVERDHFALLMQYWQHAGEIFSSRMAECLLNGGSIEVTESHARCAIRNRVAELHRTTVDNVFLFVSGMAAIAAIWRAVTNRNPGIPTCQFGFPYVDSLKIQQRFPGATHEFLPEGTSHELRKLAGWFPAKRFSAVFCETPTNPLLVVPDLASLCRLTRAHDSVLIVDDTLRACSGPSILPFCDGVTTSLTKYFSGYGNVLAGALTLNPDSPRIDELRAAVSEDFQETLCDADAEVLEQNSRDIAVRVDQICKNACILVDQLRRHPAVDVIYYPVSGSRQTPDDSEIGASGGLFSVVLRDPARNTPVVFDALQLCKGPNLGTNFTLCCPYTILAHYRELKFAEQFGVSQWLLRFSTGVEPIDVLWGRIAAALALAN